MPSSSIRKASILCLKNRICRLSTNIAYSSVDWRARVAETPPKNPSFNPASTFVYGILLAVSSWSLYTIKHRPCRQFSMGMLTLMVCHALIGILRFGHPYSGRAIKQVYDTTATLVQYSMLALVNMDIYLSTKQEATELAYLHLITIALPAISHLINEKTEALVTDLSAVANIASCIYLGYLEENPWTLGLATVAAMNHLLYSRIVYYVSAPKQDLFAIGLSFYNVFTVHALNGTGCEKATESPSILLPA